MPPLWTPCQNRLDPEPGWVHVFRLALDLPEARLADLGTYLSEDERARAARYLRETDRQRFTTARGQVREILAAYLNALPGDLRFIYNEQGKPALPVGEL